MGLSQLPSILPLLHLLLHQQLSVPSLQWPPCRALPPPSLPIPMEPSSRRTLPRSRPPSPTISVTLSRNKPRISAFRNLKLKLSQVMLRGKQYYQNCCQEGILVTC